MTIKQTFELGACSKCVQIVFEFYITFLIDFILVLGAHENLLEKKTTI